LRDAKSLQSTGKNKEVYHMEYKRYFVALKEDDSGYEFKSRESSGQCTLESRGEAGKIWLSVQEMKANSHCKAVLVFPNNSRYTGVSMGTVHIGEKGKGELKVEFPSRKIGGIYNLDSFVAVALIAPGAGKLAVPLSGFKNSTVQWKNDFTLKGEEQKPEAKPAATSAKTYPKPLVAAPKPVAKAPEPEKPNPAQVAPAQKTPVPAATEAKPAPQATAPDQTTPEAAQPAASPISQASESSNLKDLFKAAVESAHGDGYKLDAVDIERMPETEVEHGNSELDELFETNAQMSPFEKQTKDVKWVRISMREPIALPIDYLKVFNNPFIISSYEKYNHFIIGRVPEGDTTIYMLGVPAIYNTQNMKTAKSLGFTQFKCVDNVVPADGEYGYCLLGVTVDN
jgi:hypothetical protein